jgi:hypothetical protein
LEKKHSPSLPSANLFPRKPTAPAADATQILTASGRQFLEERILRDAQIGEHAPAWPELLDRFSRKLSSLQS